MIQEELAGQLKTKGPVIGRYARDEMKPSIESPTKMAKIREVSLVWLVCNTDTEIDTCYTQSCIGLEIPRNLITLFRAKLMTGF